MTQTQEQPFFFSVKHIIKPYSTKLIYGIRYKDIDYFLFKTFGLNDCEQLDDNPKLDTEVFDKMCDVITEIEKEYNKTPPIEAINIDVFNVLVRAKNPKIYDPEGNSQEEEN